MLSLLMGVTQFRRPAVVLALPAIVVCLAVAWTALADARRAPAITSGRLTVLTYNIAGLPEGISRSRPTRNIPLMSKLLNAYDVVLVQEDFAFHAQLVDGLRHAHRSLPSGTGSVLNLGDGLNQFTIFPFRSFARERWSQCNGVWDAGNDCLAPKGFTASSLELAPGISLDLYNLHMDAGPSPADVGAREAQATQLLQTIAARSSNHPILVAGDTNVGIRGGHVLTTLLEGAGLTDACSSVRCPDSARVDRVLFRSGGPVRLNVQRWRIADEFVDASGAPLSDHAAVAVDLTWTTTAVSLR